MQDSDFCRRVTGPFGTMTLLGLLLSATLAVGQDEEPGAEAAAAAGDVTRPTNEQIMSNPILRNALSRSSEELVFRRAPDGTVSVDLQGRFQNVSVARIDADGEIRTGCVASHASLAEFLSAHPEASEEDYAADSKGHGDER